MCVLRVYAVNALLKVGSWQWIEFHHSYFIPTTTSTRKTAETRPAQCACVRTPAGARERELSAMFELPQPRAHFTNRPFSHKASSQQHSPPSCPLPPRFNASRSLHCILCKAHKHTHTHTPHSVSSSNMWLKGRKARQEYRCDAFIRLKDAVLGGFGVDKDVDGRRTA